MKEEDLDWKVYHILIREESWDVERLAAVSRISPDEIGSSLERLVSAHLAAREGTVYKALSIQEMLMQCQSKYDKHCPFVIENGTIRMKSRPGPRDE